MWLVRCRQRSTRTQRNKIIYPVPSEKLTSFGSGIIKYIIYMKIKSIIAFASAGLLLGSCGIYNKYERPDVNVKGLVRDSASIVDTLAVSDTTSFGNLPWRSVFTDPQLQSLIEQGLTHNTNMLNAALNVKMVEEQLMVAKLALCHRSRSRHRE